MASSGFGRIALCLALCVPGAVAAQQTQSASAAAELSALMNAKKADVVAAVDPGEADRFVAAMVFPGVQLLVMSARYDAPAVLRDQIAKRQYADVYAALQQSSIQDSRIFFQDLKADGLHLKPGAGVDVMYERVVNQTIFDGNPTKQKMSEAAYAEKFKAADTAYSHMLTLLVQQVRASSVTP